MTSPPSDNGRLYEARELFDELVSNQRPEHYFRGQYRDYPPPLWPSAYRPFAKSADSLAVKDALRLRGTGQKFNLRLDFLEWEAFGTKDEYEQFVKECEMRQYVASLIRNALGYPLAEAFMQQVGLRSEGVDVTADPLVAFFFATHELRDNRYEPRVGRGEPAVIYRWTFASRDWSIDDLNGFDFYTCPNVVPTDRILRALATSPSRAECVESIDRYRRAIGWGALQFDRSAIAGKRPLHLLEFPEDALRASRVAKQKAALLLPDTVRSHDFLQVYGVSSPEVRKEIENGTFVEDLASSRALDAYRFDPSTANEIPELRAIAPDAMFPRDDYLFRLLRGWVKSFLANPYGVVPLQVGGPRDWMAALPDLLKDWETKLFV